MVAMMTIDFQNCLIFILMSLFSLLCYYLFFKKPKDGEHLPPSPPSLPIIGHLHHLLSPLIHKSLQRLSSKYGSFLHLRVFNISIVLVSSASITYEIFKAHDANISTRDLPTNGGSLFFGSLSIVTSPCGEYWKFMKKLIVTKLLGPQALERSRGLRAAEVERFYSNLLDKAMKKERLKISEEAMKLVTNSIYKMIVGSSSSEEIGEAERVRVLVSESDTLLKKFFLAAILRRPLAKLGISLFKKELEGISRKFDEVLEKILMDYKEKQYEHHQSTDMMIDVLLEAIRDENAEYKITRNHIKSLLADLFIAGTDTSTHAIQWIMAEIINNPNILERLREEIDSVVGNTRLIQEIDLPNLTYLQAVVKEGLRLHPPVPLAPRTFQEGCKIGSFYIPEKTRLLINFYGIMRDPDLWENPEEFKPERFLSSWQEGEMKGEVLKFIPFGNGRRGCPGSILVYLSVGTAVGVMVQGFEWKIEGNKVNMEEARGAMSLSMAYPPKCTIVPRTLNLLTSSV